MKPKTLYNLYSALAKLDAAFPTGDYNLNEKQNVALNGVLDSVFQLKQEDSDFAQMVEQENHTNIEWQMDNLVKKGLTTKE